MIRLLKNYMFELLPFDLVPSPAEITIKEGEWGVVAYDADTKGFKFDILNNAATPTPLEAQHLYIVLRGTKYLPSKTNEMDANAMVTCIEPKSGLLIWTDQFSGVIAKDDALTVVGQTGKGAVIKTAGAEDVIVGYAMNASSLGYVVYKTAKTITLAEGSE